MVLTGPNKPKIGIPWRTSLEEATNTLTKMQHYMDAVSRAGAAPVPLSLSNLGPLQEQLAQLDGFVLPGSQHDINPSEYSTTNCGRCEPPDTHREEVDRAVLGYAFAEQKPVLAICYGCQLLNVFLGGTLIQDIRTEHQTSIPHRKKDIQPEPLDDPRHEVRFTSQSQIAKLAGSTDAVVNSSHHQAIATPGRQLSVTGQAPDGIVETVEWTGDANWVIGVQWHPERMVGDPLADRLFSELISAARGARRVPTLKS